MSATTPTLEDVCVWVAQCASPEPLVAQLAQSNLVAAFANVNAKVEVLSKALAEKQRFRVIAGGVE